MGDQELELLHGFNGAFNRHDVTAMMAMMIDDCVFENTYPPPDGTRYQGQSSVRASWQEFFSSSTEASIHIEDMLSAGGRGVQRWTYRWRHSDGSSGSIRGVDVLRSRQGRIAEKLSYVKG